MGKNDVLIIADAYMHPTYKSIRIPEVGIKICLWEQGSSCVEQGKADVVVIDCGTKINKGLQLLKASKSLHPRVPVILLTDVSSEDHAISAFRSGAREYFRKPVNILKLQKLVALLLKAKKSSKQSKLPYHHGYHLTSTETQLPADTNKPASILNAIRFMEEHYDRQLSLEQIAQQARLSKYYFIRHFKDHTGMSPIQFLNLIRIDNAKELMSNKGLNSLEVAQAVGFYDYSSFLRKFKKLTGKTPRQFKESLTQRDIQVV